MEVAGSSREAYVSVRLNGAESLVKEVITRVGEFKKNAEKVDEAIKCLKQKVIATKNYKRMFVTKIDIIKSSRELVYVGEKMQDLTSESIAKLQVHVDRMIQILSFLNKMDNSSGIMMEIEREETGKRLMKKKTNRKSDSGEIESKEKLATPRVNAKTDAVDTDSSEDEFSARKMLFNHIPEVKVSRSMREHPSKKAKVLESTFVNKGNMIDGKREYVTFDRISRKKRLYINEDIEMKLEKNRSISVAASKMQHSEETTSMHRIEELPFDKWNVKSTRKKTSLKRSNNFSDEACDFVREIETIKNACGDMANVFDESMQKASRKRISTKENDAGPCKSKILVLDKNFRFPEQNNFSQISNENTFSILEPAELSSPSSVSGCQSDSLKQKQKLVKSKYSGTAARKWHSIADSQNASKEQFVTESKSRRQAVEMGKNRPIKEIELKEEGELSEVCRSESCKMIADKSNNVQKSKAARMVLKERKTRKLTESEEESDLANSSSDEIYLHSGSSNGIYVNARNACVSKERHRKSKYLLKNFNNQYFSKRESSIVINENEGMISSAQELDLAEQNMFGMCSGGQMKEENILSSGQEIALQNRKTRQYERTSTEADEPMLVGENKVSLCNYISNMRATASQNGEVSESARHNHSPKMMEKPSSDESRDSPIAETVDFPDIYTSWHRILEQFIEIQSHNSTYLEHLEAVFEHVSDIYGILDMDSLEDQPRGLSEEEINNLPVSQYSKQYHKNAERWSKDTKCSICLSQYVYGEHLRNLPCLHDFHADCVDKWLQRNNTCPTCRRIV